MHYRIMGDDKDFKQSLENSLSGSLNRDPGMLSVGTPPKFVIDLRNFLKREAAHGVVCQAYCN